MSDNLAALLAVGLKYGTYLFFIVLGFSLISSFISKLRNEPGTLFKLLFVTVTPFAVAIAIAYFVLHEMMDAPFWLNLIAGLAIYAVTADYLGKRIRTEFKDEISR